MKNLYSTLFFGLLCLLSSSADAGFIYLGDPGVQKIQRANLDGSGLTDLVTGVNSGQFGLTVDMNRLYWSGGTGFSIQSSNLDGSSLTTVSSGSSNGGDLEILGNTIYEGDAQFGGRLLLYSKTSGSFLGTRGGDGLGPVSGIASDGTRIYSYSSGQIFDVDITGTGVGDCIVGVGPSCLASSLESGTDLEQHNGFFYFGSAGSDPTLGGSLWRIALDGTGLTELITSPTNRSVHAISIANNRLYWTELESNTGTSGAVLSANLDGSGKTTLISGLNSPSSLFVTAGTPNSVPEPASATLVLESLFLGFVWGPALRRRRADSVQASAAPSSGG